MPDDRDAPRDDRAAPPRPIRPGEVFLDDDFRQAAGVRASVNVEPT